GNENPFWCPRCPDGRRRPAGTPRPPRGTPCTCRAANPGTGHARDATGSEASRRGRPGSAVLATSPTATPAASSQNAGPNAPVATPSMALPCAAEAGGTVRNTDPMAGAPTVPRPRPITRAPDTVVVNPPVLGWTA